MEQLLKTGRRVVLVGASGSRKPTVSKLISGLYMPWDGEILFDGKSQSTYPQDLIVDSVVVLDPDIILFEDTIANNIKMWDESIQDFEMILAALMLSWWSAKGWTRRDEHCVLLTV